MPSKYAKAPLRSRFTALRSGHITRDIREMAQLAISPNFAPFSRKTSYIPNVKLNRIFTKCSFRKRTKKRVGGSATHIYTFSSKKKLYFLGGEKTKDLYRSPIC